MSDSNKKSFIITGKNNRGSFKTLPDKKWYAGTIVDLKTGENKDGPFGPSEWIKFQIKIATDKLEQNKEGQWKVVQVPDITGRTVWSNLFTATVTKNSNLGKLIVKIKDMQSFEELGDPYADDFSFEVGDLVGEKVGIYVENTESNKEGDSRIFSNATDMKSFLAWKGSYIAKYLANQSDNEDDDEWDF